MEALSHRNDPITSYLAAEKGDKANDCRCVLRALITYPSFTSSELAYMMNWPEPKVAKRLSDLKRKGFIDTAPRRKCTIKKSMCCPYKVI